LDPLRDDGLIYEQVLREEHGTPTKLDLFSGLPHGFWFVWKTTTFTTWWEDKTQEGWEWLLQ
jgi:acetyl esterase/lipase